MKNKMKRLIVFSIVAALSLSCTDKRNQCQFESTSLAASSPSEVTLSDGQVKSIDVRLGHVEKRQMGITVKASGMLDVPPQNLITISAPLGGFIKFTDLLQGMKVTKGQVLLVMEHPDYIQIQQEYLESSSQLEYLAIEYKRQQELAAENVNAAKTLQQSKSNYLGTKAKVEGLKAKLRLININPKDIEAGEIRNTISILSPITGFLTQVNINIGMHVNPTDVLLRIVDTEHLHAEAQVFEKDISRLRVGQTVRIRLSSETVERAAKVFLIGKEITAERTVRVHCHLINEDPSLIPGMYFTATIETDQQPSNTLPSEAIVNYEGKNFIFVANDPAIHHYEMVEIVQGISEGNYVTLELADAFQNKFIVVKGTYALLGLLKNKGD